MNKISIGSELADLEFNVRNAYIMIGADCFGIDHTPSVRSYETPNSYRLRILKDIKRRSKMFKDTDLDTLSEKQLIDVFDRALEALRAFAYIPEKDFHFEERMNFWRYNEELTVIQAALLCVNEDPAQLQNDILKAHYSYQPIGFNAVFSALTEAILAKRLNATLRYDAEQSPDWMQTIIRVDDLKVWLLSKNLNPEFFFPETQNILCHPIKSFAKESNIPDYLNKDHPRYSEKLAAAVEGWLAMEEQKLLVGKTPKTAIKEWLKKNYSKLGTTANEECAKIANWDPKGGAPKTPVR